jgi:tripartite-type tricarboxylate transporter receptor subunit TctC
VARFQWVFVAPASSSAATLPEFIDQAKTNVALRQYGVPIIGGTPQMMGEAVAKRLGYPMTMVPFSGAAPLMPLLMGGQINAGVVGAGEAASLKKSGKVRLLAISGEKRSSVMPEVPTFEELGVPGVKLGSLYSLFAPKELPRAMAERVNKALQKSVTDPKVLKLAHESSLELETSSLTEFQHEMADIDKFWQHTQSRPLSK